MKSRRGVYWFCWEFVYSSTLNRNPENAEININDMRKSRYRNHWNRCLALSRLQCCGLKTLTAHAFAIRELESAMSKCMNYRLPRFLFKVWFLGWTMKMKRRSREISIAAMKIKCVSLLSSPSRDRVLAVSFAIAHVAREQLGNDTSTDIRNDIRRLIWRVNQARNVILDKFVLHSRVIVLLPQWAHGTFPWYPASAGCALQARDISQNNGQLSAFAMNIRFMSGK